METENVHLLIAAFQRAPNYPRDDDGIEALISGLQRASEITGVSMKSIVSRCCLDNPRCPTDAEMMNVARGIRKPTEFNSPKPSLCRIGKCDGSGWEVLFRLKTQRRNYVEWNDFTRDEYERAQAGVTFDAKTQQVYSFARRCACGILPLVVKTEAVSPGGSRKSMRKFSS